MIKREERRMVKPLVENGVRFYVNFIRTRYTFIGIPLYTKFTEVGRTKSIFQ